MHILVAYHANLKTNVIFLNTIKHTFMINISYT